MGAPKGLLTPKPTPTPTPMTRRPMATFMMMRFFLLMRAMQAQEPLSRFAAFALAFQSCLPGHIVGQSFVVEMLFMAYGSEEDVVVIIASMSVSKGFSLRYDRGVERLLSRGISRLFSGVEATGVSVPGVVAMVSDSFEYAAFSGRAMLATVV